MAATTRVRFLTLSLCLAGIAASDAIGAMRVTSGLYVGIGVAPQPVLTVGYQPTLVIVKSTAAQIAVCRSSTMSGSKELGAATAFQANRINSLDALGFTVGTHASVNAIGGIYHWTAFSAAPGEMAVGSYGGDGSDNRAISGLSFTPDYVMVLPSTGQNAVQRFGSQSGDASFAFDASAAAGNLVQSFVTNGFVVGTSMNANGTTYHYVAWRESTGSFDVGSYTGDGVDNRSISDPGFQPAWVVVRGNATQEVHRPITLPIDSSVPFLAGAMFANAIQQTDAAGFQIGTNAAVNTASAPYYYFAAADNQTGQNDLSLQLSPESLNTGEGENVALTATLGNAGPATAGEVAVDFAVPAGLSVTGSSGDGSYSSITGRWTVTNLASGGSAVLTLQATVEPGTAGSSLPVSAAVAESDRGDPVQSNDSDSATFLVNAIDLAVNLSAPATASPGDTVSLVVDLSNLGQANATGVALELGLPAGMQYVSHTASAGTFNGGSSIWSVAVGAEDAEQLTVRARVSTGTQGQTLQSSAAVTDSDQSDLISANDSDQASVYIGGADIAVTIGASDTTPIPGQTVVFTITATNNGPDAATGVAIDDILPPGLTYVLAVPNAGSYSSATGRWQIGALGVGVTRQLLLTTLVDLNPPTGVINNVALRATSSPTDYEPANDSATAQLILEVADLSVELSSAQPTPTEGDTVTVLVELSNDGPADALQAQATVALEEGLEFIDAEVSSGLFPGLLDLWVVDLPANTTQTMTLRARVLPGTSGQTLEATGSVPASLIYFDPDMSNNEDSQAFQVQAVAAADLDVTLGVDDTTPRAGEEVEFTVTAANAGPSSASGVSVALNVDSDLIFSGATASAGSFSAQSGAWSVGSLASGGDETLVLTYTVASSAIGQDLAAGATISAASPSDPDPGDNSSGATLHVASADLGLALSSNDYTASPGDTLLLQFVAANDGPDASISALVQVTLPAGLSLVSSTTSNGSFQSNSRQWTVGPLSAQSNAQLQLTAIVGAGPASLPVSATILSTNPDDPSHADWTSQITISVSAESTVDVGLALVSVDSNPRPNDVVEVDLTIENGGSGTATGLAIALDLDAGLSVQDFDLTKGSLNGAWDTWEVGALAAGGSAELHLELRVANSAGGQQLVVRAVIDELDQSDGNALNDSAEEGFAVRQVLSLRALPTSADPLLPGAGGTTLLDLELENPSAFAAELGALVLDNASLGSGDASAMDASVLPIRLLRLSGASWVLVGSAPMLGGSASFSGLGSTLPPATTTRLRLEGGASVQARDGDQLLVSIAHSGDVHVENAEVEGDFPVASVAFPVDGMSAAQIQVYPLSRRVANAGDADVLCLDLRVPPNGYVSDALRSLRVTQLGDFDPSYVQELKLYADGGNERYDGAGTGVVSDDHLLGTATRTGSTWTVPNLAESVSLSGLRAFVVASLDPEAERGTIQCAIPIGSLQMSSANDGPIDQQVVSPSSVLVFAASDSGVAVSANVASDVVLHPGDSPVEILRVRFDNRSRDPVTLDRLRFATPSNALGTVAELDASWSAFRLTPLANGNVRTASAAQGIVSFSNLGVGIAAGQFVEFDLAANASLAARDGDLLGLSLEEDGVEFEEAPTVLGAWPLGPGPTLPVDGMTVHQVSMHSLGGTLHASAGDEVVPVAALRAPRNGYAADRLDGFSISQSGSAVGGVDYEALELWADDGDGQFEALGDALAGSFSGGDARWTWSGNPIQLPADRLLFVTATLRAEARAGRSLRFRLPIDPSYALQMQSGNDGPFQAMDFPDSLVIQGAPITWDAPPISVASVHPGSRDVSLLRLRAHTLQAADLQTLSIDFADIRGEDPDRALDRVSLYEDTDLDGLVSVADDLLGQTLVAGGRARFVGLTASILDGTQLLLAADLALHGVADGDRIAASIDGAASIQVGGHAAEGAWPLQSGEAVVDGMVAAQVAAAPHDLTVIGPGSARVLAFEFVVPSNGPLEDELHALRLVANGNASSADLASLRLARDGGDGIFATIDDVDLGELTDTGNGWSSAALGERIPPGGARLFVSAASSASPGDSAYLELGIPLQGISVESDNDGPLDAVVPARQAVLIVGHALDVSVVVEPGTKLVGSDIELGVRVENSSDEAVELLSGELLLGGDPCLEITLPPAPGGLTVPPQSSAMVRCVARALLPGTASLNALVVGRGVESGRQYRSIPGPSTEIDVRHRAERLMVDSEEPRTIQAQRGDQVAIWELTLRQEAGPPRSEIHLRHLRLHCEDEAGTPIPARDSLIHHLHVRSVQGLHAMLEPADSSDFTVSLDFPVRVAHDRPVELELLMDVSTAAQLGTVRLVLMDSSSVVAHEEVDGDRVEVAAGERAFPLRSHLVVLFGAATALQVSGQPPDVVHTARGRERVVLADLWLQNPGEGSLGATIDLEQIGFQLAPTDSAARLFRRLWVETSNVRVAELLAPIPNAGAFTLPLTDPVRVPANAQVPLRILADIAGDAPYAEVQVSLADTMSFRARDRQSRDPVPVRLEAGVVRGNRLRIERPVDQLTCGSLARLPDRLVLGTSEVQALEATFAHPGDPLSANAVIEAISLECRDGQFLRLVPSEYVDAVRVYSDGRLVGERRGFPPTTGAFQIPIDVVTVAPGGTARIALRIDFAAAAPTGTFQMIGETGGMIGRDANSGLRVPILPEDGSEPALFSGLTRLQLPARLLAVGLESTMPPLLAAGDIPVMAGKLRLSNPATDAAGDIAVEGIVLRLSDRAFAPISAASVDRIFGEVSGEELSAAASSQESAVVLNFAQPISVPAGETIEIPIGLVPGSAEQLGSLRLGVDAEDVLVVQPTGALFRIAVATEAGTSFPLWTSAAQIEANDLRGSFSNYPNPFAAGRETTTFVWFLPTESRVELRLWTLSGDRVATLYEGSMGRGLHQLIQWDGRNGKGGVVTNGSYIAELAVVSSQGSETVRRKVAVVR